MGLLVADTSPDQIASLGQEYADVYWSKYDVHIRTVEDLEDYWPKIQLHFQAWWKSKEPGMIEDFGDNSQEMDIDLTLFLASEKAQKLLHQKVKELYGISEVVHSRLNYILRPLPLLKSITGITALTALIAKRKEDARRKAFNELLEDEVHDDIALLTDEPIDIENIDGGTIEAEPEEREDVYETGEGPDEVVIIGPPLHDAFVRAGEED